MSVKVKTKLLSGYSIFRRDLVPCGIVGRFCKIQLQKYDAGENCT